MSRQTTDHQPSAEPLWDVGETARYLGMSRSWVYRESAAGRLPSVKLNGWALRFVPEQVRSHVQTGGAVSARVLPMRSKVDR